MTRGDNGFKFYMEAPELEQGSVGCDCFRWDLSLIKCVEVKCNRGTWNAERFNFSAVASELFSFNFFCFRKCFCCGIESGSAVNPAKK